MKEKLEDLFTESFAIFVKGIADGFIAWIILDIILGLSVGFWKLTATLTIISAIHVMITSAFERIEKGYESNNSNK